MAVRAKVALRPPLQQVHPVPQRRKGRGGGDGTDHARQRLCLLGDEELGHHHLLECRKIVVRHGGHISARNDPDRGTVFSFTLPAA